MSYLEESDDLHPTWEQLWAFDQGQLRLSVWTEIASHVIRCDACCRELEAMPDDNLVVLLRAWFGESDAKGWRSQCE
jgi:hypothetical protein